MKNCEVIIYNKGKIPKGHWAIVDEDGKIFLEIYMKDCTIKKRISGVSEGRPMKVIAMNYGLEY